MKKLVKSLGLAVVLVCLALSVFACGDKTDDYKGTYEYTLEEGDSSMTITLELNGKGKVTQIMKSGETETSVTGSYSVDGETITITAKQGEQEVKQTGTIKDGTITIGDWTFTKK